MKSLAVNLLFNYFLLKSHTDPLMNEIIETIDLLIDGESQVEIYNNYRNVTLFIGNQGIDKSTLTLFAAGRLADLKAIEGDDDDFTIETESQNWISSYPNFIVDDKNTAFYNCPGYNSNSMSAEIVGKYFLKKVVDHSNALKLVLVADYDSVNDSDSINSFHELVKNIYLFMNRISEYKDAISFVATKVEQGESDETIVNKIAEFFINYRAELSSKEKSSFNQFAIRLVDILLNRNGEGYDKISLFRKPDRAGPLNKIKSMVEGRKKIRDLIINRTKYVKRGKDDFGYTISSLSNSKLVALVDKLNKDIKESIEKIGDVIEFELQSEAERLGSLVMLTNRFENIHSRITSVSNIETMDADLVVEMLTNLANEIKVTISFELFDNIRHLENYILFLQFFSTDSELEVKPKEWMKGLNKCVSYLERSKKWFKFLTEIYDEYSRYDFRKDLDKYNVKDINDWGRIGKAQGIYITQNNFRDFIGKQKIALPAYENFPNEFELQVLNDLLQITLKDTIENVCDEKNSKLVVKGHYVRLAEIDTSSCEFDVRLLHIFASHTVFFDKNFVTNNSNIVIVAPTWHIVENKQVTLAGFAGDDIQVPAKSGTFGLVQSYPGIPDYPLKIGEPAEPGIPGLPGLPAFNFVGLGKNFINGMQLQINSVGGNGGRGQDGGRATDGYAPLVSLTIINRRGIDRECDGNIKLFPFPKYKLQDHSCHETLWVVDYCDNVYEIEGVCPGQGGEGGRGGYGGFPGTIRLFNLGTKSNIKINVAAGSNGDDGADSPVGRDSVIVRMRCHVMVLPFYNLGDSSWTEISRKKNNNCLKFAKKPKNEKGIVKPMQPPFFDASSYLGEYLGFERESQIKKLKRDDVLSFVDVISSDDDVVANYSLNAFVNELFILESQYYALKDRIELQNYYYSLSKKLEKFVANPVKALSQDELKVFTHLYTAAWGKYLTLKTEAPYLIIDIKKYLDSTMHTINTVRSSKRKKIINDYQQQFHDQILSKINEANSMINDDIMPTISDIKDELVGNMNNLLRETVERQNELEAQVHEYQAQLKKLNLQMKAQMVFGLLDVVGTFTSCLGPYGIAAGMVIKGTTQIGKGFYTSDKPNQAAIKIPAGVKATLEGAVHAMKKRKEQKIKLFNEQIKNIQEKLSAHSDVFGDTLEKIDQIQDKLKTTEPNDKEAFNEIDEAEKELKKLIEDKKSEIEKKPPQNVKVILTTINGISNALTVLEASNAVYEQYKSGEQEMQLIRTAMDSSMKDLKDLQKFERSICGDIWPMLTEMLAAINDIEKGGGNSHVAVDVKKFKIKVWLRDIKYEMHKFVKDFESEEDILQTFQKLNDVYLTLMNIYDHIESYQDQSKHSDFIAHIASADSESIYVTDPKLNSALIFLDEIINSNVLLNEYKSATDGFKHAVFPFAGYYFDSYKLPPHLQNANFSLLVTKASSQLERLKTKLERYTETVINENDEFIVAAAFVYGLVSSEPFYEWKFENYGKVITDLLSGKSVEIRADIKRGVPHNAVKFNRIKLLFVKSKPSLQVQLEKKLLKFDVKMTHMGNSYYRCGSSYYIIHSPATVITYSNQVLNGVPVRQNNVYKKLLKGDILLSPYATWNVKLEYHSKGSGKTEFVNLKSFANETDLLLVGKGIYVKNDVPVCSTKAVYYKDFEIDA